MEWKETLSDHLVKLLGAQSVSIKIGPRDVVTIGRSADADFILDDSLVSRRHCSLHGSDAGVIVSDLGSRNGTEVNGVRVRAEVLVRPGDQIRVGRAHFLVDEKARTPGSETASLRRSRRDRRRSDGKQADEAATFLPPATGYEPIELLASGSSTLVYHARSQRGQDVAVKMLRPGASFDQRTRFLRSADVLARLDHPNLARVVDVCDEVDRCFFAMGLIQGESLADIVERRPLGARQALSIGVQIARALSLLHQEMVIHRDVRPENVMVIHGGIAKLVGFGFVKDLEASGAALTKLSDAVGDPSYIPPEQVRDPRDVDHRSDLYGLGATLFHALTGQAPFQGTPLEVVRRVLATPAPRLGTFLPGISPLLEGALDKLLAKSADDRFQSATDVMAALDHALMTACRSDPRGDASPVGAPDDGGGVTATQASPIVAAGQLGGGFTGLELLEIVQFLELNEKDGRLAIETGEGIGEIVLQRGLIAAASVGAVEGEAAARRLLAAPQGTFEFRAGGVAITSDLRLRPAAIALDLMRARDEEVHPRS